MSTLLSKLGLGTAQFSAGHGGPNPRGRPLEAEVSDILKIADRSGFGVLDTAVSFGQAEALVGAHLPRPNGFRIVIKTARCDRGPDFIQQEARASLLRLGIHQADAIMVQQAGDLFGPHGPGLWHRLLTLRDQGLFKHVGISVYASDDPLGVAERFKPDIIQVPASLLDQRLLIDGTLAQIRQLGIEVQLRSIFLQGILFLPPDRMPNSLQAASARLSRIRRMIAEGRSDPLQAALGFALSRPEASSVIVGVTTAAELSAIVAAALSPLPDLDWDDMALDDVAALDSGRWGAVA